MKFEGLEIAYRKVAQAVALGQCIELLLSLFEGTFRLHPALFCSTTCAPDQERAMKPE
ncbi:MAG: hypothetical protein OXF88_04140 [Rhodobacteraceae bacterium]|nr:hypothetical protein [Paracoccaceae bacterium]MCY4141264.1 hypothetical protein [Paracoccaceae bacterium]